MSEKPFFVILVALIAGLLGGTIACNNRGTVAAGGTTISGRDFALQDDHGRTRARLCMSAEGSPTLFFYDASGRVKLSLGTYGDGGPVICLNDDMGQAVALLRVAGKNGAPVLVEKLKGQDRLILGLNLTQPGADPFLWYATQDGKSHELFGQR